MVTHLYILVHFGDGEKNVPIVQTGVGEKNVPIVQTGVGEKNVHFSKIKDEFLI